MKERLTPNAGCLTTLGRAKTQRHFFQHKLEGALSRALASGARPQAFC